MGYPSFAGIQMVGSSKNESSILNLGELIDRSLDLSRVAVIEANPVNPRQVTYGELDSLANAVARGLSRFPIGRRDRVAIVAGGSVNFLGAYLGILRAGGVAVLVLNLMLIYVVFLNVTLDAKNN